MFDPSVLERIDVIAHSGIRIGGETIIYIDPVKFTGAPHDADLILFTHPHFDHFSPRDVKKLMKDSTVIAAPKSMAPMIRMMLRKKPVSLLPGQRTELAGIPVSTVAAYNKAKPMHLKAMKWLGYILTIGDTAVYVSGDTDLTDECRSVTCDIALLPVGGFYTMDPVQAAALANTIQPHTVIPLHYGRLLGGEDAAERFRSTLNPEIHADIRPSACSNIMVSMYAAAAVLLALGVLLGILAQSFLT